MHTEAAIGARERHLTRLRALTHAGDGRREVARFVERQSMALKPADHLFDAVGYARVSNAHVHGSRILARPALRGDHAGTPSSHAHRSSEKLNTSVLQVEE